MELKEEYEWLSEYFKGEDWALVKKSLTSDFGFIGKADYEYISPNTGEAYKFSLLGDEDDAFVSRIEVLTEVGFKPIPSTFTDKDTLTRKYEELDLKKKSHILNLKRDVIDALCSACSVRGFTALLNEMVDYPAIQELKTYLGMDSQQEFFSIQFLELDFENYGGLLCKVVRRKPSVEHRAIKTPCGTFYAVPIKGTFEDLVDCLISFKTLLEVIGFQGIIDNYSEDL